MSAKTMQFGAIIATIGAFLLGLSVRNSYSNNVYFGWTYTYQNPSACLACPMYYTYEILIPYFLSALILLSLGLWLLLRN